MKIKELSKNMLYNIFLSFLYIVIFYLICIMGMQNRIKFRAMAKFIVFIVALFWGFLELNAIGFAPVRNFTRQSYGAGSQNWAVAQDPAGRVYFANRDGLLKYDGTRWSLYHLPNYTTVRSVYADDFSGRIYAGGSNEFGYFHTDSKSLTLRYVSLVGLLPDGERNFSEIWNIISLGRGVFAFQGDFRIFIIDGKKVTVLSSKEKITASAFIDGQLYAGLQSGDVMCMEGGKLTLKVGTRPNGRVVALMPSYRKGEVMAVTSAGAIFSFRNDLLHEEKLDISPFLHENQAFCATCIGSTYAFGTVNGGAVVKDFQTGNSTYINKSTGLQNNTVLGLGFDFEANLWLCLDNGISYAMVDSPVYNLLGEASDAGAGYGSLLHGNKLFLATNRGLFSAPYPFEGKVKPPVLSRLHTGQVWSIDSVGADIFISADDGLYLIGRGSSIPVRLEGMNGGNWYVSSLNNHPGKALASSYSGFYLLSQKGDRWTVDGKVEGYDDGGGKFVESPDGSIWLSHWLRGVYRLTLSSDLKQFSNVKLYTAADGLPSERENSLSVFDGKLRISTASGEFFNIDSRGKLVPDIQMNKSVPLKGSAHFYTMPSGLTFAFSPSFVWKISPKGKENIDIDSISLRKISSSLIPGFEHVSQISGDKMLVAYQDGFYIIDLSQRKTSGWKNAVCIESVSAGDSILFSGLPKGFESRLEIPYSMNSLTFHFAAPEYRFENGVLYSCKLEEYDTDWSTPSEVASKEYTRLHEGNYTLRVKAYNTVTGDISETALSFYIAPPWYRSGIAKIIYALLIIGLLVFGFRTIRFLSERKAEKIKREKESEMKRVREEAEKETIKKDYEIATLKSKQLELDIKHKSSELSNTAMNVIRKNEILLDISGMLNKLHDKAEVEGQMTTKLKKEVDKIQNLIKENISHDDDWKKFNQNFDIVYADFIKHLSEIHPDLTVAEKRLCCYLKMGLSSKEIAPILSISPKSVEMNRYRLRRKLSLTHEDNLVGYLNSI